MNKKAHIENEIQKTLDQFDQAEKLPHDPWFYTRLQAQLDSRRQQRKVLAAVLKPAMLTLLVLANIGTAAWYLNSGESATTSSRQELVELLANDFNVNSDQSSVFNLE